MRRALSAWLLCLLSLLATSQLPGKQVHLCRQLAFLVKQGHPPQSSPLMSQLWCVLQTALWSPPQVLRTASSASSMLKANTQAWRGREATVEPGQLQPVDEHKHLC